MNTTTTKAMNTTTRTTTTDNDIDMEIKYNLHMYPIPVSHIPHMDLPSPVQFGLDSKVISERYDSLYFLYWFRCLDFKDQALLPVTGRRRRVKVWICGSLHLLAHMVGLAASRSSLAGFLPPWVIFSRGALRSCRPGAAHMLPLNLGKAWQLPPRWRYCDAQKQDRGKDGKMAWMPWAAMGSH